MTRQFFSMLMVTTLAIILAEISSTNAKNADKILKAKWMGVTLAEAKTSEIQMVEGNVYFPPKSVQWQYLEANDKPCSCPWKGPCVYYDVVVNGKTNPSAAWVYQKPFPAAKHITWHAAFSNGVAVE